MLAISLAALLLIGPPRQANSAPENPNQDQAIAKDSVHLDSAKSQMPAKDVPPETDPAAMNQTPIRSQGVLVNGNPKQISRPEMQKKIAEARARNEPHRQAAIRINEMAANIHSEKDARSLVDAIAEELTNHKHLLWAALKYRHRVAHAEFEAVSDPANLISDQRIADIWNEYVREIDAPEESLVTQEEVHRLRTGRYRMSKMMWSREYGQSIWTMPNVRAVAENGMITDGGRPLEMLDVLNHLYNNYSELLFARERIQKGTTTPVALPQPAPEGGSPRVVVTSSFLTAMPPDPIRPAEARYQQEHGETAYRQLLERLFDELFPPQ
jgi:hypothetical protein